MKDDIRKELELGKDVQATLTDGALTIKGPKGTVTREYIYPQVSLTVESGKIVLQAPQGTKREKKIVGSFQSHIRNMILGVQQPYIYKLKVCSGHFPITAMVSGSDFVVKNFLGETVARKAKIITGAEVKVTGAEITVSSADLEAAGQMAARIEKLCRITNRDLRIFQDGIYIIEKPGKY